METRISRDETQSAATIPSALETILTEAMICPPRRRFSFRVESRNFFEYRLRRFKLMEII